MEKIVAVAFIKNGKLLIVQSVRSAKNNVWTCVGGGVLENEDVLDAAKRESEEEIGNGFKIDKSELLPLLCYKEPAISAPSLILEITVFIASKDVDVELIPNEEIVAYHWLDIKELDHFNLSSSIKHHVIPYCLGKKLLY